MFISSGTHSSIWFNRVSRNVLQKTEIGSGYETTLTGLRVWISKLGFGVCCIGKRTHFESLLLQRRGAPGSRGARADRRQRRLFYGPLGVAWSVHPPHALGSRRPWPHDWLRQGRDPGATPNGAPVGHPCVLRTYLTTNCAQSGILSVRQDDRHDYTPATGASFLCASLCEAYLTVNSEHSDSVSPRPASRQPGCRSGVTHVCNRRFIPVYMLWVYTCRAICTPV